jgi:hypothetical protein
MASTSYPGHTFCPIVHIDFSPWVRRTTPQPGCYPPPPPWRLNGRCCYSCCDFDVAALDSAAVTSMPGPSHILRRCLHTMARRRGLNRATRRRGLPTRWRRRKVVGPKVPGAAERMEGSGSDDAAAQTEEHGRAQNRVRACNAGARKGLN